MSLPPDHDPVILYALERLEGRIADIRPIVPENRRQHERQTHGGRSVDWWQHPDGTDVCGVCHPRPGAP